MKKLVIFGLLVAAGVVAFVVFYDAQPVSPEDAAKNGAGVARDTSSERAASKTDREAGDAARVAGTEPGEPYTQEELLQALARHGAAKKRDATGEELVDNGDDSEVEEEAPIADTDQSNRPNLTVREEQVMVMYDEMADVLEEHAENCVAMSAAVDKLIESNERTISSWKKSQAELDEKALDASRSRVESAAPERLARLRQNLRVGLAKCKGDESLMTALGKLAALNN